MDEVEPRTKIAQDIENDCLRCLEDIWCGKDEKNQDCNCICHHYAGIARGNV